jgi:hypothetical protein
MICIQSSMKNMPSSTSKSYGKDGHARDKVEKHKEKINNNYDINDIMTINCRMV